MLLKSYDSMPQNSKLPNLVSTPPGYAPLNSDGMQLANLALWHLYRIGNTGLLAAPPEGTATQPVGTIPNPAATQRRVWLDEPPGSIPFDEQASQALPTSPLAQAITVLTMTVPHGYDGVIKWVSNNAVTTPAPTSGQLVWGIQINNRPVRNFGMITQQKGTIAQGRQISPIRLFSGDVVTYTVTDHNSALVGETVCSLTGYYFPAQGVS